MNFNKVIIWGLKDRYHTHRYIHQSFFENIKSIGIPVVWVEDTLQSQSIIEKNDLIIASEVHGKMVPQKKSCADYYLPIRDDIWYCLHGFQEMFLKQVPSHRRINLEVYSNTANQSDVQWGPVTFFNTHTQTLYQPWGTNLRAEEFYQPTFSHSPFVFWVGSIWNNTQNQGNLSAIAELRTVLKEHKLYFVPVRFIPNSFNTFLIRHSRIAPAIAGQFQVDVNYLPCRMFKNISYGQLGFSNVKKFADILGPATLPGNTLAEMVDHVLRLSKNEYITLVQEQQKQIKNYTYVDSFNNIKRAFDMLR